MRAYSSGFATVSYTHLFCISASAERDGLSLVAVVMAAPTKENRTADATALLNYCLLYTSARVFVMSQFNFTPLPLFSSRLFIKSSNPAVV